MKKIFYLMFSLSLALLAACGGQDTSNDPSDSGEQNKDDVNSEETSKDDKFEEKPKEKKENDEDTGKEIIEGLGHVETVGVGYNEEVGIDGTEAPLKPIKMASMELEIEMLHVLKVKPDKEGKELFFSDDEEINAIVVIMKAKNTEEKDIFFDPDNAILTTDTGEQLESGMVTMLEVDEEFGEFGEFFGKVEREGIVWWFLENIEDDISSVKMIIDPPFSVDNGEEMSKEKRIEFDILTFEEAIEKDVGKEL